MKLLTIWTDEGMEILGHQLKQETLELCNAGLRVDVLRLSDSVFCGYQYSWTEQDISSYCKEMAKGRFYQRIVNLIENYFFQEKATEEIKKILQVEYCYFDEAERRQIFAHAKKLLIRPDDSGYYRKIVNRKLEDYIQHNTQLNLAGFLQFRLKSYGSFLRQIIALAAEAYVETVEYNEFIDVLKFFVAMNSPQMERIHIVNHLDHCVLFDEKGAPLIEQMAYVEENATKQTNDFLVTALINLAPQEIIFHGKEEGDSISLARMLKNIFADQLKFCNGCVFCNGIVCLDSDLV